MNDLEQITTWQDDLLTRTEATLTRLRSGEDVTSAEVDALQVESDALDALSGVRSADDLHNAEDEIDATEE